LHQRARIYARLCEIEVSAIQGYTYTAFRDRVGIKAIGIRNGGGLSGMPR